MALDGALINIICRDLEQQAIGCRIEKITMPYKDAICLYLNKTGFKKNLLISANPNSARLHFTTEKFHNPPTPPMLCMLLRKKLGGARLKAVRQHGIDRILCLDFDCKNEMGDDTVITVAVELLGRLSNIIFIENGKIIDSTRRIDPEDNKRFILPGASYEFPKSTGRLNLFETDSKTVADEILKQTDKTALKAFSSVIDGLSPILYRELCFLSVADFDKPITEIKPDFASKIVDVLDNFKQCFQSADEFYILRDENGEIKDFTFFKITQYGAVYTEQKYTDVHTLLQDFFEKKDNAQRIKQLSASVTKTVNNLISRTKRKIFAREKELKNCEKKETYRIYGELIKANLHLINAGDKIAKVMNYYDEDCGIIEIPLEENLSPVKNSHRYFNLYRKLSTAQSMLSELIEKAKADLVYFESVLESLRQATSPLDIEAIKDELHDGGYIRFKKNGRLKKSQKPTPQKYISSDGFVILVGKNNYQNDYLTTKLATKQDIWFHTKDIPGSHVVVLTEGEQVPDSTLTQAAIMAATCSKAENSKQVAVDYTPIKYVKKPSGAKPGMVIYKTNKTAYVDPDKTIFDRLERG